MSEKSYGILSATRPGEYVAFFTVLVSTKEGPAFIYMAIDAYSEFAFHLGIAKDESPANILKYIYLLTENPDFLKHRDKGFTLVLEKYEELSDRINTIINHVSGKLLFNKAYNNYITLPVLKSLGDLTKNRKS